MPRRPGNVPAYCLHKHSGQAIVYIDGVGRYLGTYGSPESYAAYERLVAEWRVQQQERLVPTHPQHAHASANLTVEEVLAFYWHYAKGYYVKDGQPTKELSGMKYAIKPVRRLYGSLPAREFGPLALKAVRQSMIDADLCRTQINARINRIRRVFRWAVSEELVPPSVHEALRTVQGLRFGRTEARESEPVRPVPDAWVDAVLPFVTAEVAAMIQVQRCTGMRPGEVVMLRMSEIDTSGDIWVFQPTDHKTRWRDHSRQVPIGPKAQAVIKQFTTLNPADYLFSPRRAEERRHALRREQRKSPMTPSQALRKPLARPRRAKREHYDTSSYNRAIQYGFERGAPAVRTRSSAMRVGPRERDRHGNLRRKKSGTCN
jgi:integrase